MYKFTTEQEKHIVKEYQSGIGTPKLAQEHGCTKKTIQFLLKRHNAFKGRKKFTEEELQEIKQRYLNYETASQIAKDFEVGERAIKNRLIEMELYTIGKRRPKTKHWTDKKKKKAVQMYKKGKRVNDIARHFNVTPSGIRYTLVKNKVWKFKGVRKYTCNFDFFEKIDTEEKAYWLGFIGADGNVFKNCLHIGIHENDVKHLEKFSKHITGNYPVRIKTYISRGKPSSIARIDIHSNKIINDLYRSGITPKKSHTISWQKTTKNIPKHLIHHFVRGYFDGDGSWKKSGKNGNGIHFSVACGSGDFILGLQKQLCSSCGLSMVKIYSKKTNDKKANNYALEYGGRLQEIRIYNWMYNNATLFLERKKDKAYKYLFEVS